MDWAAIQNQLNDLPRTFKRQGAPYTQLIDAITAGLFFGAAGDDGTLAAAASFPSARFGWVDVWGLLFNVPRNSNEADASYMARIVYQVTAGGGPPVAIAKWIKNVFGIDATIIENLPIVGYIIQFAILLTTQQVLTIVQSLAHVRPAGVPFTVLSPDSGLYLDTINFLDGTNVTGDYLTGANLLNLGLSAGTNNTPPTLPTLFLTDTVLNPGLVA